MLIAYLVGVPGGGRQLPAVFSPFSSHSSSARYGLFSGSSLLVLQIVLALDHNQPIKLER